MKTCSNLEKHELQEIQELIKESKMEFIFMEFISQIAWTMRSQINIMY